MTLVEFHFVSPNGEPVADTEIEIQLARSGFDEEDSGVIMPRLITAMTDADGKTIIELLPSLVMYYVTVYDSVSEAALHYKFYVPDTEGSNLVVRLQDIIVDGATSGISYDEAALIQISNSKSLAIAAMIGAQTAAATAVAAAESIVSGTNGIATASENIPANSLCYVLGDGSLALSDASAVGKPAELFVPVAVTAGNKVSWYGPGSRVIDLAGLVPGDDYYMSTNAGQFGASPVGAAGSGIVVQKVGVALTTTSFLFNPSIQIIL